MVVATVFVLDDLGEAFCFFGFRGSVCFRRCRILGFGRNGKFWSNYMVFVRNVFLGICGFFIWVVGDGAGLDRGGGIGSRGDSRFWIRRGFSWINTRVTLRSSRGIFGF